MRVDGDTFRFTAPVGPGGLVDVTGYTFTARVGRALIDVSAGALSADVATLGALLADRRQELEGGIPGAAQVEGEGATRLCGEPARTLRFSFEDRGERFSEQWTLVLDTPESYVQVAHAAPADDPRTEACREHLLASAAWTDAPRAAPPGWVRRWAGKLWLDVPVEFRVPRSFKFVASDEALRVEVSHHARGAGPSLTEELARDTARGEVVQARSSRVVAAGPLRGTLHAFTLRGGVRGEEALRRAQVDVGDRSLHVYGRADGAEAAALDAVLAALLTSIERVDPAPGRGP